MKLNRLKYILTLLVILLFYLPLYAQSEKNNSKNETNLQVVSDDEYLTKKMREKQILFHEREKPTWALIFGGIMTTGGLIMGSSNDYHNDSEYNNKSDHMSANAAIAMAAAGIGLLVYYFLSDDEYQMVHNSESLKTSKEIINFFVWEDTLTVSAIWNW
jgi:hypothetical protein